MIPLIVTAVAAGAAASGLAYLFYTPIPDDIPIEDRWLIRKIYVFHQTMTILERLGKLLGKDAGAKLQKRIFDMSARAVVKDSLGVESRPDTFRGVSVTVHTKKRNSNDASTPRPALFYIHGGGWVHEFPEIFALMERHLAYHLDAVVVSVHYRLAPQHPYPAALEDCLSALRHLHANAGTFNVNPEQISVAGDSAGGNLTAAVTLKLRDAGERLVHRQILISPVLQAVTFHTTSCEGNSQYGILTTSNMIKYWLIYARENPLYANVLYANQHVSERITRHKAWRYLQKYQTFPQKNVIVNEDVARALERKLLDPYLCPMMADSLAGLPPALVLVSEYDVLRDDALAYADRLTAEGVETTVDRSNGIHGIYCMFGESVSGRGMVQRIVDYLGDAHISDTNIEKSSSIPVTISD